jgi:hypothetical protein
MTFSSITPRGWLIWFTFWHCQGASAKHSGAFFKTHLRYCNYLFYSVFGCPLLKRSCRFLGRVLINWGLEQDAIDVRYGPKSGARADVARLPSWANKGHQAVGLCDRLKGMSLALNQRCYRTAGALPPRAEVLVPYLIVFL